MNAAAKEAVVPGNRLPWRDASWLLMSSSTQAAVAFGSNLVLVRFIAPEGFGRFALALASLSLIYAFASLKPGQLVIREQGSQSGERRALLWNACVQESLLLAAAAGAVLLALGATAFDVGLWVAVALAHFGSQARGFLERSQRYRSLSFIEGGAHVVAHSAAVALVLNGAGVWALVGREILLATLQIAALRAVGGLPRERFRWLRPQEWRALASDAKDLWASGLLESLHARLVVMLAGLIGGVRGAGLFFQAQRLAQVPHQFLQPIAGRLSFNWFARASDGVERDRRRRVLFGVLAAPLILATVVALTAADELVPFVLGASFAEAAPLLASLAGVAGGTSLLALVNAELLATGRFKAQLAMRAAQYVGLLAAGASIVVRPDLGLEALGLGLGLGIAAAVVVGLRAR